MQADKVLDAFDALADVIHKSPTKSKASLITQAQKQAPRGCGKASIKKVSEMTIQQVFDLLNQ